MRRDIGTGKAWRSRLNYLIDKGAFTAAADGTFAVDFGKQRTLDQLAVIRPVLQKASTG